MLYFNSTHEGTRWNTYHCLVNVNTILDLTWRDSWFWQTYRPPCTREYTAPDTHNIAKVWYSIVNLGEVGSTAVYLPSWNRINSVRKVANATLQSISQCKLTCCWRARFSSPILLVLSCACSTICCECVFSSSSCLTCWCVHEEERYSNSDSLLQTWMNWPVGKDHGSFHPSPWSSAVLDLSSAVSVPSPPLAFWPVDMWGREI